MYHNTERRALQYFETENIYQSGPEKRAAKNKPVLSCCLFFNKFFAINFLQYIFLKTFKANDTVILSASASNQVFPLSSVPVRSQAPSR